MSIAENIASRKAAEAIVELADEAAREPGVNPERFWSVVCVMAADRGGFAEELKPAAPARNGGLPPMSDQEARDFGQRRMPWGKHVDTPVDQVPLDYLRWASDEAEFSIQLRRYYESKRVQMEVGDDE